MTHDCSGTPSSTPPRFMPASPPTRSHAVTSPLDRLRLFAEEQDRTPDAAAVSRPPWRSPISSIAMGRLARGPCRSSEPRPAEGDVGDRDLPHRRPRRSCRGMRGLRPQPHRLQQLPQPALPQMPGRGGTGLAGRARGRSACRSATSTSCSPCRPRSPTSPSRTRRWSTICCSAPRPRRCSRSPPIRSTSAPASASPPCSIPGARR